MIVKDLIHTHAIQGLQLFLLVLLVGWVLPSFGVLFLDHHGWSHRLAGAFHLMLLTLGACTISKQSAEESSFALFYDLGLGVSGVTLTVSAARDFPHRHVRNVPGQSGTLSSAAMVTQAEMLEHAFYQGLNLWQALYLHFLSTQQRELGVRWGALLLVTAPWWIRGRFPVHSFSNNWRKHQSSTRIEKFLYRIKKWQYVFYKHVILHGINLSLAISPRQLATTPSWRIFWLCLNTSYVMEFFLQSLVKRKALSQSAMLVLNQWLMGVSSLAALVPLWSVVQWPLAMSSLLLNFMNRHHDVWNTMLIGSFALFIDQR